MTPAENAIKAFGGIPALAKAVGRHESRIHRWTYPKGKRGGTGGLIPSDLQGVILEKARRRGLELTADDLIPQKRRAI